MNTVGIGLATAGLFLAFHRKLDHKKQGDEQQKTDEDFVASFVKFLVQTRIFAVNINCTTDKSHQKNRGKRPLALCKHCV